MINKLSASRINLYTDCSLKYKFQYIDQIKKPISSVHLVFGSAVHKALEMLNKSLPNKLAPEDVLQIFHNEWVENLEKEQINPGFIGNKLYTMGLNSILKIYEEFLTYELISSELHFDVPINDNISINGLIDAIIKQDSQIIILDYKTSKEPYDRFKLDTSIQLAVYSYAFRYLLQNQPELFPGIKKKKEDYIAYCVILKDYDTLEGNIKIQKKKIEDKHMSRMLYILDNSLEGIKNKIFLPNYNSQCQYCEFKKECLDFSGA